jgi:hypothetical protein
MAFYDEIHDVTDFVSSWTNQPKKGFGIFARGYTLAANRLAKALLRARRFSDYEAYPVVFLYRHALELSLKHVIYSSIELAALRYLEDVDRRLQNSHDLTQLSKTARDVLMLLFPEDKSLRRVVSTFSATCDDLARIDPRSDGYRYPIDKNGKPSTKRHQVVNLQAFAARMSSVLEDLDTIHFGVNIETDKEQEVLAALRGVLD